MRKWFTYSGSLIAFLIVTAIMTNGCYYDKEELLYPGSFTCDTAAVKYSTTVVPIVTASCYTCHAGNFPSGGVKLDTYNDIRTHALSGRLYGAISHANGFVPMPQSAPKLSDCKINAIKRWIDDGAPNN